MKSFKKQLLTFSLKICNVFLREICWKLTCHRSGPALANAMNDTGGKKLPQHAQLLWTYRYRARAAHLRYCCRHGITHRESDSWDGGGKCNGSQASPLTVLTFISRRRVHFALLHYARHFTREICPGCNKRMMWWCSTVMSMWHPTQFTALSLTVTGSPVLRITISFINIHSLFTEAIYHHDCCGRPSIEWLMDHLTNITAIRCGKLLWCQHFFKEKTIFLYSVVIQLHYYGKIIKMSFHNHMLFILLSLKILLTFSVIRNRQTRVRR